MQAHVGAVVEQFLAAADRLLGQDYQAMLYGSAARGEHVANQSDLNLLLVTKDLSTGALAEQRPLFKALEGHTRTPPLLFTPPEWSTSADVFPIEITDMKLARKVLRGADPVASLMVDQRELRRALERELRGKLLRVRQGYAIFRESPAELTRVAVGSIATVAVLLRVALALADSPVPGPTPDALRKAGGLLGFDAEPLVRIFEHREKAGAVSVTDYSAYLDAVTAAVRFVDQFHVGGQ